MSHQDVNSSHAYFDTRFTHEPGKQAVWRAVIEYLQSGRGHNYISPPVLDAGAGYCYAANAIGGNVVAVDRNPEPLEHAKPSVETRVDDVRELDIDTERFATVLASNLLEHLSREGIESALREFHRILVPGGQCVIITPNIALAGDRYWNDYTHQTPLTLTSTTDLLRGSGFDIERVERRFLPFESNGRSEIPGIGHLVRSYLKLPPRLRPFAGQSLVVGQR